MLVVPAEGSTTMKVNISQEGLVGLRVCPEGKLVLLRSGGKEEDTDYVWETIVRLICDGNFLTSLPPLPKGLGDLHCARNSLTSLPSLPKGLTGLYCETNLLTSLPSLPEGLEGFWCHENLLSSLPALPKSLYRMRCHDNPFTDFLGPGRNFDVEKACKLYASFQTLQKEKFGRVVVELAANPYI